MKVVDKHQMSISFINTCTQVLIKDILTIKCKYKLNKTNAT